MNRPENLSQSELEQLARAYLDCRLTLLEEKELEYLLLSTDISAPLIDEARAQMVLTSMLAHSKAKSDSHRKKKFRMMQRIAATAACIAAVGLASGAWMRASAPAESFYVCIDGHELSEEESRIRAAEIEASTMATFNSLLAEARRESEQSRQIIENLNRN